MIAGWYQSRGWEEAKIWQEADEVIINSCSIRESAENRVFGLINNINRFKADSSIQKTGGLRRKNNLTKPKTILTGCMVGSARGERKRYSLRQLKKKLPQVAEFKAWWEWGFGKIKTEKSRFSKKKAFIPIMKGCNHFCSYCVVPYAKGREASFPFSDIVCQVEELVRKGWEEIVLLGQNVNSYGNDFLPKERTEIYQKYQGLTRNGQAGCQEKRRCLFALLLEIIHTIEGVKKISFLTSNPWDFSDDLIRAMKLAKISRELHLPVQSGDDQILARMNRPYTAGEYLGLIQKIKREIPEVKIGTDIIVGFPGETRKAFNNTCRLCRQIGFSKAYIAAYSPRPGTAAFEFEDDVSCQEKKRRWQILNKLINSKIFQP